MMTVFLINMVYFLCQIKIFLLTHKKCWKFQVFLQNFSNSRFPSFLATLINFLIFKNYAKLNETDLSFLLMLKAPTLGPLMQDHISSMPLLGAYMTRKRAIFLLALWFVSSYARMNPTCASLYPAPFVWLRKISLTFFEK